MPRLSNTRLIIATIGIFMVVDGFLEIIPGCTIKVDSVEVPPPEITIKCLVIELPGGGTTTVCPEAGTNGGEG